MDNLPLCDPLTMSFCSLLCLCKKIKQANDKILIYMGMHFKSNSEVILNRQQSLWPSTLTSVSLVRVSSVLISTSVKIWTASDRFFMRATKSWEMLILPRRVATSFGRSTASFKRLNKARETFFSSLSLSLNTWDKRIVHGSLFTCWVRGIGLQIVARDGSKCCRYICLSHCWNAIKLLCDVITTSRAGKDH